MTTKPITHGGRRQGAGRPGTNDPLAIRRSIRATDLEWAEIKYRAKRAGETATGYLLRRALGKPYTPPGDLIIEGYIDLSNDWIDIYSDPDHIGEPRDLGQVIEEKGLTGCKVMICIKKEDAE